MQSYALGLTITFLSLVLAAGALAAERDENVLGRLARGLVPPAGSSLRRSRWPVVVATVLGLGVAFAFGIVIVIGDAAGRRAVGEAAAARRRARADRRRARRRRCADRCARARGADRRRSSPSCSCLPIVFLGLIPPEVFAAAGWVSDALPFAHGVRLFSATLYDLHPWGSVARETGWLVGLGTLFCAARVHAVRPFRP